MILGFGLIWIGIGLVLVVVGGIKMGRRCRMPGCPFRDGWKMVHAIFVDGQFILACEHCREEHYRREKEKEKNEILRSDL